MPCIYTCTRCINCSNEGEATSDAKCANVCKKNQYRWSCVNSVAIDLCSGIWWAKKKTSIMKDSILTKKKTSVHIILAWEQTCRKLSCGKDIYLFFEVQFCGTCTWLTNKYSISIWCYFIVVLHYVSEGNAVRFTHNTDSCSYFSRIRCYTYKSIILIKHDALL